MSKVIVRIPPSPTGSLHLGTARTALFNYLFAKKQGGEMLFRWEDTDKERSETKYETEILEGLKWLGMDFEKESPRIYRQSEHVQAHKDALKSLWTKGKVFPCFSTPEEIDTLRQEAAKKKENFVFWSPYRDVAKEELEQKIADGERHVWRLRVEPGREVQFADIVRGKIAVNTDTLGDFVIAKNENTPLYLLANVVDDAQQQVSHVIRGEDHISNTPKQILIFEALGLTPPQYAHIPLVLDQQKRKLSKRNVDPETCVLIEDFRQKGFLPEGVVNGLAFLGWNPKSTEEIFSLADLEKIFDLAHVNSASAQYDFEKMRWFNHQWMRRIEVGDLIARYNDFSGADFSAAKHERAFGLAREKAKTLPELSPELEYLVKDPGVDMQNLLHEKFGVDVDTARKVLCAVKDFLQELTEEEWTEETLLEKTKAKIEALGMKNGTFLHPFRVALSNRTPSASPFEIAVVLGKVETLRRVERAKNS